MQTKQVLETIRRIETKFSPIRDKLLNLQGLVYGGSSPKQSELGRTPLEISYLLGEFIETVQQDRDSVRVLEAFTLRKALLEKEYCSS